MPETWRLLDTITAWRTEIDTYITTGITNARTEAANTTIKQIKRTGRGYRNPDHYRAHIPATQHRKPAPTLDSAGHHVQMRIARYLAWPAVSRDRTGGSRGLVMRPWRQGG